MKRYCVEGICLEEVEDAKPLMPLILRAFAAAIIEGVGEMDDSVMLREDLLMRYITEPGMVVYKASIEGQTVGAAILRISQDNKRNVLELLCVDVEQHCQGIGVKMWQGIETLYPDTEVWETETPDFSKRNVHFYVNKCGFHIVEYFNKAHQSELEREHHAYDKYGKFRLEKRMVCMNIRRAIQADMDGINKLLHQVLMVHHNGRPDLFKANAKKYTDEQLTLIIDNNNTPIFVAVDEQEEVLGYAFCLFQEHINDNILTDVKTLYIDDLCVDETKRGMHIGKQLYEYVLDFARAKGCYNVTLNVWSCNESAMKFYEKCGLVPQKVGMEKIL